jgi:hypothetical protein
VIGLVKGRFRGCKDVCKLPMMFKDVQPMKALVDENFQAALDQLEQRNPAVKSKLFEKIEDVIDGLESLPLGELEVICIS